MTNSRKTCVAGSATQTPAGIGHNGPPDDQDEAERLYELIGPATLLEIKPFQCGAPWTGFATDEELQELALNEYRIELRLRALVDLKRKRKRIMNRCIRRMRRVDGKN